MKKLILLLAMSAFLFTGCGNKKSEDTGKSEYSSKSKDTSNSSSASLEASKKAYIQGYSDGQTGYGLPASSTASAYEYYMAYGYNFSKADYNVYVMGYNDGLYGRTKQY